MLPPTPNPWIECFQPNSKATLRIFCFPHVGGGAALYRLWSQGLPHFVEVCPVELPGRGRRFGEEPLKNLGSLVSELAEALLPSLDRPFCFFGHSMGALIGFELTRHLRRSGGPMPSLLIVSAFGAPKLGRRPERPLHRLSEGEFLEELRRLKGTPPEVLNHTELMRLFIPLLRADLELVETYSYQAEARLEVPILALAGDRDEEVSLSAMEGWVAETLSGFRLEIVPGDHFFLQSARALILKTISREIFQLIQPSRR